MSTKSKKNNFQLKSSYKSFKQKEKSIYLSPSPPNNVYRKKLESELADLIPKLNEMNLIAEELGRDVKFVVKLGEKDDSHLKIKVENKETGTKYTWDVEKALDRYYCLRD